jgi:DNA processing protein
MGRALATKVAALLVDCGATVVSGLAFGIDGAAHAATLDAAGITVGIIGAGHAHAGPRGHRRLLDRIVASGGAVIGELSPDVMPTRGTFPRRNRLISALGDAVIVIEAPARSGALITARTAMEQGRPVFVAPGRPGDPATGGCLALLRETPARPIAGLDELVVDLGYDSAAAAAPDPNARLGRAAALELLGAAERRVAEQVVRGPAGPDELVAATGLAPATVSAALTLLQMRGWIAPLGPAYLARGPLLGDG